MITYKGVEYYSLAGLCREFGLVYQTVWARLDKGMTLEQAIDTPLKRHNNVPIIYKGKEYDNVKALCIKKNLNPGTIYLRLRQGMTLEQAIDTPIKSVESVKFNGVTYSSLKALCEEFGVSYDSIRRRLFQHGMTLEEALSKPIKESSCIPVSYKGRKYKSIKSLCLSTGANYKTVRKRLKRGMTIEEAIDTPKGQINPIRFNGVTYSSLVDLCKKFEISYNAIRCRL